MRTSRAAAAAVAAIACVALSACSGGDGSSTSKGSASASSKASTSFTPPAGVTLAKPGTTLRFGQAATVAFSQNAQRSTALALNVTRVQIGRIADLAAYSLDQSAATSTPYYVSVTVRNAGPGDVGRAAIPLWGLSTDTSLRGATGFTPSYARCPSGALPASFATGATVNTCLVYLMPKGQQLAGVSFRPLQSQAPIVWKGTVLPPPAAKK